MTYDTHAGMHLLDEGLVGVAAPEVHQVSQQPVDEVAWGWKAGESHGDG